MIDNLKIIRLSRVIYFAFSTILLSCNNSSFSGQTKDQEKKNPPIETREIEISTEGENPDYSDEPVNKPARQHLILMEMIKQK